MAQAIAGAIKFFIAMDIVVTGQDHEFADMSNPQGYLYGDAYYVVGEYSDGSRIAHDHSFINDLEGAEKLLSRIEAAKWISVNKHWNSIDPCYGSEAYISGGWDSINVAREKREADDEAFARATGTYC